MIEKMDGSEGKVLGLKIRGNITKADYEIMVPEIQAIVNKEESVSVLLDIEQFKGEDVDAWGDHFKMFQDYHRKIDKIAIIGDKTWEKWMTKLAEPVYSKSKFFYPKDIELAWKWLKE